jgi:hypothetical protein
MSRASKSGNTVDNASDANFRLWGKFVSDSIQAGNWTKTSDTGQINWATVTAPLAVSTVAGYEMYQSADAGVGQNNYYVKIEYGSGTVAATRPAMWITVGWAVDGAGNIVTTTYPSSTRTQFMSTASGTPTQYASANGNAANGAGYMCWSSAQNIAGLSFAFAIERTRNTDLTFKDQVLINLGGGGVFGSGLQVVDRNNAYSVVASSAINIIFPPVANTPSSGVAALGLLFGSAPGMTSPSLNFLGTEINAIGRVADIVNVTILAVVHTYIILDGNNFTFNGANTTPMMRYEV